MRIVAKAPVARLLEPAPLGAWYADRKDSPEALQSEPWDYRKSGLPAYVPEIDANRGNPCFRGESVDNGGTEALRAFLRAADARTPAPSAPRDTEAWRAHNREVFRRGIAHLRNIGVAHHVWRDCNKAAFLPEGSHPFAGVVKELNDCGVAVTFSPVETEGNGLACVIPGRFGIEELCVGPDCLLELDPNAEWLRHERAHIEHASSRSATPYKASLETRDANDRLPGPVAWSYSTFEGLDEMLAYTEGILAALLTLTGKAQRGEVDLRTDIEALFDALTYGVQASLRGIASSKQALNAIDLRTFQQLPKSWDTPTGTDNFRVTRRKGGGYQITVEHGVGSILGAIDNVFARPGEPGWLTRGRLRKHFGWQLRAAQEHLAVFRVVAQALEAFETNKDPRCCFAAAGVLAQQRARTDSAAQPIGYIEALERFNAAMAAESPLAQS